MPNQANPLVEQVVGRGPQVGAAEVSDQATEQQNKALAVRHVSVALSAGAGCGKTKVLTERYLGLLQGDEKLSLREIAAVTFTEKAARELRGRVRKSCRERMSDDADRRYWRSILRGLESATIQTFHGFCGEILRQFPLEAGVEPEFSILEESIAPTFRADVMDGCLRRWLAEKNENLIDLAVELDVAPLRDALVSTLTGLDRAHLRRWAERDPSDVVSFWERTWFFKLQPKLLKEFQESAQPILSMLMQNTCSSVKMRERIANLLELMSRLADESETQAMLEAIRENAKVQGTGNEKAWESTQIYEEVRDRLSDLRESIRDLQEQLRYDPAATLEAARVGQRFAILATDALDAFDDAKRAAGVLDFDDLILKTLALLKDPPENVREAVRIACRAMLVDEFQDTDPSQGNILRAIVGDEIDSGRLFLVGDFKQSIYRFRGADPDVFRKFQNDFPEEGRLSLNVNFRSTPGILDFVNALFGDTYIGPDHELHYGGSGSYTEDRPAVEFVWAQDPNAWPKELNAPLRRKTEARWLARLLANRLKEGWTLENSKNGETFKAEPGHVVYLFRTLSDVAFHEQALAAEGLDYHVIGGSAYYSQQEVLDLINLLSVLEDPFDEVALAGTLRGPFVCLSDDGLYWLASADGGFVQGFDDWRTTPGLSSTDRQRAGRAFALFEAWRESKDRGPMAELVDRVISESGYEAALLGEFLGDRKRANVRKLVRLARRFDNQGGFTLADFVGRLRADYRRPPREEQAATGGQEAKVIRLMTIHQAKGLEFPIVVLPDLDRVTPRVRTRLLFHPKLGPLYRPESAPDSEFVESSDQELGTASGRNLGWTLFAEHDRRQAREEALRLFYVATTRAQNHLILSSGYGADEPARSPALQLLDRRFDRATGECRAELPDHWDKPRVSVVTEPRASIGTRPGRRRPRLRAVARLIETTQPDRGSPAHKPTARDRSMDLDPSHGLDPVALRVDRLVRAVLFRDRSPEGISLRERIERVARSLNPLPTATIIHEAEARLRWFFNSPIVKSWESSAEVVRDLRWTLADPGSPRDPMLYVGSIDLAIRTPDGAWRLIAVSDSQAPLARERLRLLLSARFAAELGLAPVAEAWCVRLGPDGEIRREAAFSDREIAEATAASSLEVARDVRSTLTGTII
jgi:ATP-dependent helicase/nuclease subunit A